MKQYLKSDFDETYIYDRFILVNTIMEEDDNRKRRNLVPMKLVTPMMGIEGFVVKAMEAAIVTRSSRFVCGRSNNSYHSV